MKKILLKSLLISVALSLVLGSCRKEEDEPAPDLPPESSFVMDFTDFSNPDDTLAGKSITSYINWGHSYANVAVWSTIIKIGMLVPVTAFLESFNHQAVYYPDEDHWLWRYNFWVAGAAHLAELKGYIANDTVNWEMRITKANHYTSFLWYYGKNSFDRSGGYWILNENPDSPSPLLRIDWTYDGGGIGDISYTNIIPGGAENGGYIHYGSMEGDLTRFYDIYNKGQDNLCKIQWNHNDLHGHVQDPDRFGDNQWHCWDITLQDIICP